MSQMRPPIITSSPHQGRELHPVPSASATLLGNLGGWIKVSPGRIRPMSGAPQLALSACSIALPPAPLLPPPRALCFSSGTLQSARAFLPHPSAVRPTHSARRSNVKAIEEATQKNRPKPGDLGWNDLEGAEVRAGFRREGGGGGPGRAERLESRLCLEHFLRLANAHTTDQLPLMAADPTCPPPV